MTRILISLLALSVLASCGSSGGGMTGMAIGAARGLIGPREQPTDLRQTLTPEVLASLPGSVMLIELPQRDVQAGVIRVTQNGSNVTWAAQDGVTVAFDSGVVSATRGLGSDLMSADLSDVVRAVYGGGGTAVRVHRYLDGEDQAFARSLVCQYQSAPGQTATVLNGSYTATLVQETCSSTDLTVKNSYWIDASGVMRKSRQWVGPDIGYMVTERLKG